MTKATTFAGLSFLVVLLLQTPSVHGDVERRRTEAKKGRKKERQSSSEALQPSDFQSWQEMMAFFANQNNYDYGYGYGSMSMPPKPPTRPPVYIPPPTKRPTRAPTKAPTKPPTKAPTEAPVYIPPPTVYPGLPPMALPTYAPTPPPTKAPTLAPTPIPDTPSPVAVTPAPVAATPAPVASTPAPVAATPVPATPSPVAVTPAPVAVTPAPVASTPAPVAATPAPLTPAPVASTPAPVAATAAPVATTPAPVAATPAPVAATPAPVTAAPVGTAPQTLWMLISTNDSLTTLSSAIMATGFDSNLMDPNNSFTVFAPTDAAWMVFDQDFLFRLTTDMNYALHLNELTLYHVTDGEVSATDLAMTTEIDMLEGGSVAVFVQPSGEINLISVAPAATPIQADIDATNGLLHVIDTVLLPPFAALNMFSFMEVYDMQVEPIFTKMRMLIVAAGLEDRIRMGMEETLLAANDEGIDDATMEFLMDPSNTVLLNQVVLYHVIPQVVNFNLIPPLLTVMFASLQGEMIRASRLGGLRFEEVPSRLFGLVQTGYVYEIETIIIPPSLQDQIMPELEDAREEQARRNRNGPSPGSQNSFKSIPPVPRKIVLQPDWSQWFF